MDEEEMEKEIESNEEAITTSSQLTSSTPSYASTADSDYIMVKRSDLEITLRIIAELKREMKELAGKKQ
ncbi:MAG: hypothetical protein ACRDF4_00705 [Rhabdochlamydiaceae bacterium]